MILTDGTIIKGEQVLKVLGRLGGSTVTETINGSRFARRGDNSRIWVRHDSHYHVWVSGRDVSLTLVDAEGDFLEIRKTFSFRVSLAWKVGSKWRAWA